MGGYTQTGTNIVISTTGPHGLVAGDNVYINFTSGTAASGIYAVASVSDPTHFTVTTTISKSQNDNSLSVYGLDAPVLARSGTVILQQSTWNMSYTDTGYDGEPVAIAVAFADCVQFVLSRATNFPAPLASAGLTTPEFQLTTASGVAAQMNFIEGGILNNTGNTNGLSSFTGGNGSIVLNIAPWMTTNYTSNAGIPTLVSTLNTFLAAGQLSAAAQSNIVSFVANTTNFPYSTPPNSNADARPRARRDSFDLPVRPTTSFKNNMSKKSHNDFSDISRREFIRRAACAAVGTVAMTSAIRDLRFMNAAVAQSNIIELQGAGLHFSAGRQ